MSVAAEYRLPDQTEELNIFIKPKRRDVIIDRFWAFTENPKLDIVIGLAAVAGWAYEAQEKGHTKLMPHLLKETVESGAHPVLGFAGAWLGHVAVEFAEKREWITKKAYRPLVGLATGIGMLIADLVGETAQGVVTHTGFDYANDKYQTSKDALAAFAIGGGAYAWKNKRLKQKAKLKELEDLQATLQSVGQV